MILQEDDLNGAYSLCLRSAPNHTGENAAGGAEAVHCQKDREQLVLQGRPARVESCLCVVARLRCQLTPSPRSDLLPGRSASDWRDPNLVLSGGESAAAIAPRPRRYRSLS